MKSAFSTIRLALIALACAPSAVAVAHHGDAGRYEETISSIAGTVVALQLINPHSRIILDVEDENGELVRWQAEVSSANRLTQLGWNRSTLRPGDQVTLFGRRVRSGAPYINLSERARLIRTDTCEELYRSNSPPEGAALVCEPSG